MHHTRRRQQRGAIDRNLSARFLDCMDEFHGWELAKDKGVAVIASQHQEYRGAALKLPPPSRPLLNRHAC